MPRFERRVARAQLAHRLTVTEQQVVRGEHALGGAVVPGRVQAGGVAEERRAPRLVEGRPHVDPVAERVVHVERVLGEPVGGVAVGPAALLLQRLRQVPVVQRQPRQDAGIEQLVDEPLVEVDALRVERAAVGTHARPRGREAVGLQPHRLHERHVVAVAVVVVARDVAVVAVDDGAGHAAEGVPDRVAAAVLVGGALDLEGGGRRAEEEVRREGARGVAVMRTESSLSVVDGACHVRSALHRAGHDAADELLAREDEEDEQRDRRQQRRRRARSSSRRSSSTAASDSATCSVGFWRSSTMNGQRKSVHAVMKVNRTEHRRRRPRGDDADRPEGADHRCAVDAGGLDQLVGHGLARYCVMKNTPNAVVSVGTMTAPIGARPAELAIRMNSGMTPSCVGHRHRRDDEDQQAVAAAEAQLREGVAGERREEDDRDGDDGRDDDRVAERLPEVDRMVSKTSATLARKLPPGSQRRVAEASETIRSSR